MVIKKLNSLVVTVCYRSCLFVSGEKTKGFKMAKQVITPESGAQMVKKLFFTQHCYE